MNIVHLQDCINLCLYDEPFPIPRVSEDLIDAKTVWIYATDLHGLMQGGITYDQVNHPLVLGHEFAGGSGAGVRVAVDPAISCRISDFCRNG